MPREIELETVEFIALRHLGENRQLVLPHAGHGEIPMALPPPRFDHPVGMLGLHRITLVHLGTATDTEATVPALHFVHSVIPPNLLLPLSPLLNHSLDVVEPLFVPTQQTRIADHGENLAGVGRNAFVGYIETDGVDLTAGLVRITISIAHHRLDISTEQLRRFE